MAVLALIVVSTTAFASGSGETSESGSTGKRELRLYNWANYMDPDLITEFEELYDCDVIETYFDTPEEALAKLEAGGVSQYDICVPSDYIIPSFAELGLIQELDHSRIPNLVNLDDPFVDPSFDPGNKYSVAYQWGTLGIVYDADKVTDIGDSWSIVMDDSKGYSYYLFDSPREQVAFTLQYLGYSANSVEKDELMEALEIMLKAKHAKDCLGFEANVGGLQKVVAGTADMAIAYNGDVLQAMEDSPNLGYLVPKEGSVVWSDNMVIPAEAPNLDMAYAFINYILDAEVGARLSTYNWYATPNKASLPMIPEEQLEDPAIYPDAEAFKMLEYIEDLGEATPIVSELWQMAKTR